MNFKKFFIILLAVMPCIVSFGQRAANFHFRSIQIDDGLASNTVYSMLQDSEGFMWFGTKDGLCRYDGDKFVTFRNEQSDPNSIGNNFIRAMVEYDDGMLYVGTRSGLYRMDMKEESFTRIPIDTGNGVEILPEIPTLHMDRRGNIWIGTEMHGIFLLEPQTGKVRPVGIEKYEAETKLNLTWQINSDNSGVVWVGNRLGLLRYNSEKDVLEPSAMFGLADAPKNEIMSILTDNKGDLWLGTWESGLRLFNRQTHEYTSFFGPDSKSYYISKIHALFEFTDNSLLIGSSDGLYLFNTETKAIQRIDNPDQPGGVSDRNIYSFIKDREGGIWIGTYFGGVNYLNTASLDIYTYFQDGGDKIPLGVGEFCEDPAGNLWVGTENKGIYYFNVETQALTQMEIASDLKIRGLMMDGEDLWIGTLSRGLEIYNTRTGTVKSFRYRVDDAGSLYDDSVFSICKTTGGNIYVGTKTGLNLYDRATGRFNRVPESNGRFIYDMAEDPYGNLWFATYGSGVCRLDLKEDRWYYYDSEGNPGNPSSISNLISVCIDNRNRVFFTSEGEGIYIYDYATDSFTNLNEKDGLPNNVTYGLLVDPSGMLWVSCNKGIVSFDLSTPWDFKIYDKEDGLPGSQFNYKSRYKASDGKFYFGAINGFSSFYPQNLKKIKNEVVPQVAITQFRLLGDVTPELNRELQAKVNRKQKIRLPYDQSSFSISFTSFSSVSKSKNRYSYILEGADSKWTDADNSQSVTYVKLAPGKYVFRARGSNNDRVWNYDGASVEIEIQPPFWGSAMAFVLYLLLFLSLAYALLAYYQRKQRAKQLRHLETYRVEQETLAFQSKINFFGTIAHEIRTPLTLISAPLEELINSGGGSEEARRNLSVIEKNCTRLTALVKQMLDFRKMDSTQYIINPEHIELREYITGLYERFQKTANKKGIDFTLSLPQEPSMYVTSDPDALTKIIGNLLTNAMKFTVDRVTLSLAVNGDGTYTVRVEDNGKGVADEYKKLIFDPFYQIEAEDGKRGYGIGLALVRNLTEVLNGNIVVRDGESGGASFEFTFTGLPSDDIADDNTVSVMPDFVDAVPETGTDNRFSVLIVEDNTDMSEFIRNSLRNDYFAVTAPDASTALEILKKESFDIIISDIMMPGMDGITFVSKLKDDFNLRHIPVIILSAKTENATKVSGLLSGADVFIEKPFSISHLRAQISSLLENRRAVLDAFNSSPFFSYSTLANNDKDNEFITKLNDEIAKNIADEDFSVESLTNVLGISRSNLQRKLKSICGVSPGDYLRNYRLQNACKLLIETEIRVNEVAYMVGFSSASYFSKAFQKRYDMSPKEFINQYRHGRNAPDDEGDTPT